MMSRPKKQNQLNSPLVYTGHYKTPLQIHYVSYFEDNIKEKELHSIVEILPILNTDQGIKWISIYGMSDSKDILELMKGIGVSMLDAKDILTTQDAVSVEEYHDHVVIVVPVVRRKGKELVSEQVSLVMGHDFVLTIQESDAKLFNNVHQAITHSGSLRLISRKTGFLLASILGEIINYYAEDVAQLEDDLEELEDQLLEVNIPKDLITTIQEKRRELIRLRKLLIPFKDKLSKLLHVNEDLITDAEIPYLKDVYDHLLFVLQSTESCREILSSLLDLYLNSNDVKMNQIMKQLTLVATIFIPLTFIVGVWGMNFKVMPELDWRYGYLYAWILMIVIGGVVWWYMKKKKWF